MIAEPGEGRAPLARLEDAIQRLVVEVAGRPMTGLTHDDADDSIGTVATDDAVGFDPLPLLRALDRCGAQVTVIGQAAGILHGSQELTGDLDLLWDGNPHSAAAMAAAFASVNAALFDDDTPVPCTPAAFRLPKVVFRTVHASGDCCTPHLPWGELPIDEFLQRTCTTQTDDGAVIHYLAREDLIRMRLAVGRPKDLRRARELSEPDDRTPPRSSC